MTVKSLAMGMVLPLAASVALSTAPTAAAATPSDSLRASDLFSLTSVVPDRDADDKRFVKRFDRRIDDKRFVKRFDRRFCNPRFINRFDRCFFR